MRGRRSGWRGLGRVRWQPEIGRKHVGGGAKWRWEVGRARDARWKGDGCGSDPKVGVMQAKCFSKAMRR